MRLKAVSGMMVILLLIGLLILAFNLQPVKAEPRTWTVDDNGPADFHTIQEAINAAGYQDTIFVYNGTYYENVIVNKSISLVGENRSTTVIDGSKAGNVIAIGITANHVNVTGFTIRNGTNGIFIEASEYNIISGNIVTDNQNGIYLYAACSCNPTSENTIRNNIIRNNSVGIQLKISKDNVIYHNNFIGNTKQAYIYTPGYANFWDNGYPSGGNYWSGYTGVDVKSGPNQDQPGSDGIGDTAYTIDAYNRDRYPLMYPWSVPDIAVMNVTSSKTIVEQGFLLRLNVTVTNQGNKIEAFTVTAYANTTVIQTEIITLTSGNSKTITFTWNTTGFVEGNYTISAYATPVPGETDISDNTFVDGIVEVIEIVRIPIEGGKYATVEGNVNITNAVATKDTLNFDASGPSGSTGWINVTFPMINTTAIGVFISKVKLTPPPFPVITTNGTHYFIYFELTLSTHTITIQFGPPVGGIYTPVNKLSLLAPYIGLTVLLAVAVMTVGYVKKRKRELK